MSHSDSHADNNQAWQARREAAVVNGVGTLLPVFIDKALNAELWDVEGNRYIDFASGIAVLNTGHNHPKVVAAVREQLEKFSHTCFQVTPYPGYIELAEKLNALVPGPTPKRCSRAAAATPPARKAGSTRSRPPRKRPSCCNLPPTPR